MAGRWEIDADYVHDWFLSLETPNRMRLVGALEVLEEWGPHLGRPLVDRITGSVFPGMKELRPPSAGRDVIRVLFIFDPFRTGVLLWGGSKTNRWSEWYREAIPRAENTYRQHLNRKGL
jgi:hypothetical protein